MASNRRDEGSEVLYPQLSDGVGRLSAAEVAEHQRRRLEIAMVEAVSRHGYGGTTVSRLVALAGVSKSSFYAQFSDKEDCFRSTYESIADNLSSEVLRDGRAEGDLREELRIRLDSFGALVAAEPKSLWLVIVESLCLGMRFAVARERTAARFEELPAGFAERRTAPSSIVIRGVVTGGRQVAYRCLRANRPGEFQEHSNELLEWTLAYSSDAGERAPLRGAPTARSNLKAAIAADRDGQLPWTEPPDSHCSRRDLSQRERIMRAVAQLTVGSGYAALTVPRISGTAGVSNQTFYQKFGDKQEAFLATFEELAVPVLEDLTAATTAAPDWESGLRAGIGALLLRLASEPLFAPLAFHELTAAGTAGLDRTDQAIDRFTGYLEPADPNDGSAPPLVVRQAIGGGLWGVIQTEISNGRRAELPALTDELCEFALVPFRSVEGDAPSGGTK